MLIPQPVPAPLTRAAIFLVVTINPGADNSAAVRSLCPDLATLLRAVGFREADGKSFLHHVVRVRGMGPALRRAAAGGIASVPRDPRGISPCRRYAWATFCSIFGRSAMDLCFELAAQIMARLGDAVAPVDEVHGFRYFDSRDLLGFVDGTENPTGQKAVDATLSATRTRPSPAAAMSSCRNICTTSRDGMRCLSRRRNTSSAAKNCPTSRLDEAIRPTSAHNSLTKIVKDGNEIKIVRHNMAFGQAGQGDFGTYFIGYSRSPRTIEQMLENMFVGRPPGNYDRILDFSRAVTGNLFFAPTATFLDDVSHDAPAVGSSAPTLPRPSPRNPSRRCPMVLSASARSKENRDHE